MFQTDGAVHAKVRGRDRAGGGAKQAVGVQSGAESGRTGGCGSKGLSLNPSSTTYYLSDLE